MKLFSILGELSGLMQEQESHSVGQFIETTKEKVTSFGEFSTSQKIKIFGSWFLGALFAILFVHCLAVYGKCVFRLRKVISRHGALVRRRAPSAENETPFVALRFEKGGNSVTPVVPRAPESPVPPIYPQFYSAVDAATSSCT